MKPLEITFPKQNPYKQIAEFSNNLFILENWKRLENLLPKKMIRVIRIKLFFKIWYETIRKKFRIKIKLVKSIIFLHFKFFSWKIILDRKSVV